MGDVKFAADHAEVSIPFKKAARGQRDSLVLKRIDGKWYATGL